MKSIFAAAPALLLFAGLAMASCNNENKPADSKPASQTTPARGANDSLSRIAEMSFLDGCVENARARLGEQKAFAYCKCFLEQAKEKYGAVDSTALARLQSDTAQVAEMARRCQ